MVFRIVYKVRLVFSFHTSNLYVYLFYFFYIGRGKGDESQLVVSVESLPDFTSKKGRVCVRVWERQNFFRLI